MRLELPADAALLEDVIVPGARDYDNAGISGASHHLTGFESLYKDICATHGSVKQHPWHGIKSAGLKLDARQALISRFREYLETLTELQRSVNAPLRSAGFENGDSVSNLLAFALLTTQLTIPGPTLETHAAVALRASDGLDIARRFIENVKSRRAMLVSHSPASLEQLANISGDLLPTLNELILLGEDHTTLDEINSRVQGLDAEAAELENDRGHLRNLVEALGPLTGSDLSAAIDLSKLLKATPRRIIVRRTPTLIDESNAFDLLSVVGTGRQLTLAQKALEDKFDFSDLPDPSSLRSLARKLREAGSLWFFDGEIRSARKIFKTHSRLTAKSLSNNDIANAFETLAEHIEKKKSFCDSTRYTSLLGSEFVGLATDFDFIESVVEFAEKVRGISRAAFNAPNIREIGLFRSPDDIDKFVRLVENPRTARLVDVASSDWDAALSQELTAKVSRRHLLQQLGTKTSDVIGHKGLRVFEILDLVRLAAKYRDLSLRISGDGAAKKIFESQFARFCDDCEPIEVAINYFETIERSGIAESAKVTLRKIDYGTRDGLVASIAAFWREHGAIVSGSFESMALEHQIDIAKFFGSAPESKTIEELFARLSYATGAADSLEEWLAFETMQQKALECAGGQLTSIFESGLLSAATPLSKAFEYCVVRTVVRLAIDDRPNLRGLGGVTLNEARKRFRELDRRLIELSRSHLAASLDRVAIDPGNGVGRKSTFTGKALITNEVQKMKRHVAIRDLVQRSGSALQQLKPCFMMSPLSVAQYIPPGSIEFDLVVIDEASQMRPEDSLAALSRARRAIIVGDQKQLPPTSFFERSVDGDDISDEDAVDNESVLDLALGQYGHSRRLRWHYRSRHESLIAFSNRYFYDDELIVMPSPEDARGELGVRSTFVESVYAKGRNIGEAEAVVDAVLRFMRNSSALSVGIVAVNKEQKDLIQELLDRAIAEDEAAQRYVATWDGTLFPYFVKNLESVQGDERDVMFISTVYGPEAIGGRVAQRFGPILGRDGWRRLNVLFTRARVRVELFTSMRPSDIRVEEGRSSRGLTAFRNYLDYASGGRLEVGEITSRPPDSDFEIAVGRIFEAHGYEVVPQVGVDKYYIDMAVRHPRHGGFVLGIECDGATYHSSRSARDRDRTREEVLTGLGWSLYRIWSTDWFANPAREFEKLDGRLRDLTNRAELRVS